MDNLAIVVTVFKGNTQSNFGAAIQRFVKGLKEMSLRKIHAAAMHLQINHKKAYGIISEFCYIYFAEARVALSCLTHIRPDSKPIQRHSSMVLWIRLIIKTCKCNGWQDNDYKKFSDEFLHVFS